VTRREYDQSCSLACALDRIGERWSLLIVRELLLGPLRFSDLVRSVGGAPTDVLTRRLRDLEADGIVGRRALGPPAGVTVYELTEVGRGLERPIVELGRWGLNFQRVEDLAGLAPSSLANGIRMILLPPAGVEMTVGLRSGGQEFRLRIEDSWAVAARGAAPDAVVTLAGEPLGVLAALVVGEPAEAGVEIEGDRAALQRLREMIVLPDRLREEALSYLGSAEPLPSS
jgi:DNA-binding HxlR family transcriptional regulator